MSDTADAILAQILTSLGAYRMDFRQISLRSGSDDLGSGGYGTVKLGVLHSRDEAATSLVAVKILRPPGQNRSYRTTTASRLAREAKVWAGLIHPNILRLVGFCLSQGADEAWLISPYEPFGNLTAYLLLESPDLATKMNLCLDTARGLLYLHTREPVIVHGDLKPANVVIGEDGCAKLCDFGLAKVLDDPTGLTSTTTIKGSPRYMGPELLDQGGCPSTYSDVWAFGCLAGEVLSGLAPYYNETSNFRLMLRIMAGEKPIDLERPHVPKEALSVIENCWRNPPASRIPISACVDGLALLQPASLGTQLVRDDEINADNTNEHSGRRGDASFTVKRPSLFSPLYPPLPHPVINGTHQSRPGSPYRIGTPPRPVYAYSPYPPPQIRAETERELQRVVMLKGVPGPPPVAGPWLGDKPGTPYTAPPPQQLIYASSIGAASAGRSHAGSYNSGYPGFSPSNRFSNSSIPQLQIKPESYESLRSSMMETRQSMGPLTLPSLSMTGHPRSHQDAYSLLGDSGAAPNVYGSAPTYWSPSQYAGPSPANVAPTGPTFTFTSYKEESEGGDIDGEPLSPTQMGTDQQPFNPYLPLGSSFSELYAFDRRCVEVDPDPIITDTITPQSFNKADTAAVKSLLSMFDPETVADLGSVDTLKGSVPIAVLQRLQQAFSPPPTINSAPMYVAQYGTTQLQFTTRQMELLHLYRNVLCNLQYHIAHTTDSSIADELFDLAMHSESALNGMLTLTSLYKFRLRSVYTRTPAPDDELIEVHQFKEQVASTLLGKQNLPNAVDRGDAMAGLHMVSAVLFEGGTDAQWDTYLNVAKTWVQNHPVVKTGSWNTALTLADAADSGTSLVTGSAPVDKKSAFIIKTTAWFDVIGAITMRRAPFFLATYRELFGRQGGAGMERIMGCNERVLLAIAETAALAKWRWDMERRGCLSYMKLAARARAIEEHLRFVGPQYNGATFEDEVDELLGAKDAKAANAHDTRLVSSVFRAAGKLYLHTVVSKCNPDVPEIRLAVRETVEAFRNLAASTVDRSLVFPIALAGCLTDSKEDREYLTGRLRRLGKTGEAVGNSKSCLQLMQAVWKKRDAPKGPRDVDWIDTMKELGWSLLLV